MRRVRGALVILVLVIGGLGSRSSWAMEDDAARQEDAAVVRRAGDLAAATAASLEASLTGATAVVRPDGSIDVDAFRRFATELTQGSPVPALALEPVVLDSDREAFERRGVAIVDRVDGEAVPSPRRPAYYPVVAVIPTDAPGAGLLGFDIGGDPGRGAAAEEAAASGRPTFSAPVPSQPTGTLGFFLIAPLYGPGLPVETAAQRSGALVGFVSTAFTGARLADTLTAALPAGTRFEVHDGGDLLARSEQPLGGGPSVSVAAANRTWTVVADGPTSPDHRPAVGVGVIAVLLALLLWFELTRIDHHNRAVARSSALIAQTAALAEALAVARTVEDVVATVDERVPALLGATSAWLAVGDADDRVADSTTRIVLPAATGPADAALRIAWPTGVDVDDDLLSTAATIAEVCGYALDRARHTDDATRRATQLAELATRLTNATTVAEVAEAVTSHGRDPIDAMATSVGLVDGDRLAVHHGASVPADYRSAYAAPLLTDDLGFATAARTGETLLFEDQAAYASRFPDAGGPAGGARAFLPLRLTDGRVIGAIAHLWEGPRSFGGALRSTMQTIADLTGQALERARLMASRTEAARQAEELAHLAEGLATRTSAEDVMAFLTQAVLPPLGAVHAAVAVRDGSVLRRYYTPGARSDALREVLPTTVPLDAESPLSVAARTGRAVLIDGVEELRERAPAMVGSWERLGFAATANLPLRDRAGALIGSLGVAWDRPVRFDDLRDRLATVAGIAGQTLERAQLVDRVRAQSQRDTALARLAEAVATARSEPEVREAIVAFVGPVVEAAHVALAVVDDAFGRVEVHPDAVPPQLRARLDAGLGAPDAPVRPAGRVDDAVVGLRDSGGRRLGLLAVAWDGGTELDEARWLALRSVGDLCAQALERARLSDAEHRVVATLQANLLVPLPETPELAAAARYLPAVATVGMGGDWYEGVDLEGGRYVLVVGDVAGHGITAVGQMAELRSLLGAVAALGTPLDQVFDMLGGRGRGGDLVVASAVVLRIDTAAATVEYASAGHLPPLVRMPDGTVELLDAGRRPLIGLRMPGGPPATAPFPPGAVLVCYTDGLVERRDEIIDDSVARLATELAAVPSSDPGVIADALLDRCLDRGSPADDVAVAVVVHRS